MRKKLFEEGGRVDLYRDCVFCPRQKQVKDKIKAKTRRCSNKNGK